MFQECATDSNIWLVKLKKENTPFIYKFTLPAGVVEDEKRVNSFWNHKVKRLVIPIEEPLDHVEVEEEQSLHFSKADLFGDDVVDELMQAESDFEVMKARGDLKGQSTRISPDIYKKH